MAFLRKNQTDNGYNSVLKEYDFYHNDDNDFEVIDEIPNESNNNKNDNNDKNNISTSIEDLNNNKKFKDFILTIFRIIFNARNQSSEFYTKSKRNLKESSFQFELDELLEYDNLGISNNNDKKKYFIDFYLIKNNNDDNDNDKDKKSLNSAYIYDNQSLLVERWKIKYKEKRKKESNNIKNFDEYFNKKIKIIEKSVVEYTRLLPLYNISKNKEKYSINFKFNPPNKKKFIDKDSTCKIKLVDDNIFSFKLSIKYLKIRPDNIDDYIKKISFDFDIIPSIKSRKRFLSDSFHKKSSAQLLNDLDKENEEDKDDEKINNNEKAYNNNIIENYIDDRRLSYENKYDARKYIYSKFSDETKEKSELNKLPINDSGSICSNEDNFELVVDESDNAISKSNKIGNINNKIAKTEPINTFNIQNMDITDINKENSPRKCQTYKETPKYNYMKSSELLNIKTENKIIKNILQDYKNVRRIIKTNLEFDNINNKKLITFISNN